MEREISVAIELGVTLMALSVVISLVWFTVFVGHEISNDVSEESSLIIDVVETGALKELCDVNTIVPTSAAYSLSRNYSSFIPDYQCKKCSKTLDLNTEAACLLQHMTGKVSLEVNRSIKGGYSFVVHHMNCSWFSSGVCNCSSLYKK